jgi:hypothetical protein
VRARDLQLGPKARSSPDFEVLRQQRGRIAEQPLSNSMSRDQDMDDGSIEAFPTSEVQVPSYPLTPRSQGLHIPDGGPSPPGQAPVGSHRRLATGERPIRRLMRAVQSCGGARELDLP